MIFTNLIVTAYIATGHVCANGHYPRVGYTCAAGRDIPLGTRLYIDKVGWRVVEDRTALKYNGRVDVFVDTKQNALNFGKQRLNVKIQEKP